MCVCVFECACMCFSVFGGACVYVCTDVHAYMRLHLSVCVCVGLCESLSIYVSMSLCVGHCVRHRVCQRVYFSACISM